MISKAFPFIRYSYYIITFMRTEKLNYKSETSDRPVELWTILKMMIRVSYNRGITATTTTTKTLITTTARKKRQNNRRKEKKNWIHIEGITTFTKKTLQMWQCQQFTSKRYLLDSVSGVESGGYVYLVEWICFLLVVVHSVYNITAYKHNYKTIVF